MPSPRRSPFFALAAALSLAMVLASAVAPPAHAFTIHSPIALVADDPQVASRLHDTLKRRFKNIVARGSLAEARAEAAGDGGFEVAIVVASTQNRGTITAYGSTLEVCQVMVTAQVLRLPAGRLEFSKAGQGKAPDCAAALGQADAELADDLLKGLEEYRRRGLEAEKEYLWVQLVDDWSPEDLAGLYADLLQITGVRTMDPDPDAHLIQLEIYRDPKALAREMNQIESVRVSRFAGRRVTLSSVAAAAERARQASAAPRRPAPPPITRPAPPPIRPVPAAPGSSPRQMGPSRDRIARLPATRGERWALVVGVSRFADSSIPQLTYPAKDARAFADVLRDPSVGRFSPDKVVVLLDNQATTRRLKKELNYLARFVQPEDLFVFFVSSHAAPGSADMAGDAYIVTYDTETRGLYETGFPMRELVDALEARIKAQTVVGFLDACHTGQIVDRSTGSFQGAKALTFEPAESGAPPAGQLSWSREWDAMAPSVAAAPAAIAPGGAGKASPGGQETPPPVAAIGTGQPSPGSPAGPPAYAGGGRGGGTAGKNLVFISSSDGDQPSWESEALGHGFFTYYLMEAMRQTQGQATIGTLFDYLKVEVKRAVYEEKGKIQEPVIRYTDTIDFPIAAPPR